MADPQVSIIIPCYNDGILLREAVASACQQTFPDKEIIIVNDGSTDPETLATLESLEEEGIRVVNQSNQGLAAARNKGISVARGEYVLPLDADDRISENFLEFTVAELGRCPEVGIVYGHVELFGERTGPWAQPEFAMPDLLFENMIVAASCFRKDDWKKAGGYRSAMRHAWEDWDLWLALVGMGRRVVRLPQVTFYYRISATSMTSQLSFCQKLEMMFRLIIRHRHLYVSHLGAVIKRILHPGHRNVPSPRD